MGITRKTSKESVQTVELLDKSFFYKITKRIIQILGL